MDVWLVIDIIAICVTVIGAATSIYFARESKRHSRQSLSVSEAGLRLSENAQLNVYIDNACRAWHLTGPFPYIHSLHISDEEKEIVWQQCFLRCKGRLPARRYLDTLSEEASALKVDGE